jgi:hypothetical protein
VVQRAPDGSTVRLEPGEAWLFRRPLALRRTDFVRGLEGAPGEERLGLILGRAGVAFAPVPAPSWNIKITTADDWAMAQAIEQGIRPV